MLEIHQREIGKVRLEGVSDASETWSRHRKIPGIKHLRGPLKNNPQIPHK